MGRTLNEAIPYVIAIGILMFVVLFFTANVVLWGEVIRRVFL